MIVNNRKYRVRHFTSVEAANAYLEKNPEWGVLHVEEKPNTIFINKQIKISIARNDDRGIPVRRKMD